VSTEEAYKAFDKDSNGLSTSKWSVLSTTTSTIQYKGTEKRILKSWRMRASDDADTIPRQFTIEGSNDGLNWTAIDSTYTASDFTDPTIGLWSDLQDTSANTTAYLYHRADITLNHGDGAATEIAELEFNTILPADYYLVEDGKMYGPDDVAIERTYLAKVVTNSDGEVISIDNFPVAKQNFGDVEVHNDLLVQGDLIHPMACTAMVRFDGSQNPPLEEVNEGRLAVVDVGTGLYEINVPPEIDLDKATWNANSSTGSKQTTILRLSKYQLRVSIRDDAGSFADPTGIVVQIFGGKS
jgi:hypothetical protein